MAPRARAPNRGSAPDGQPGHSTKPINAETPPTPWTAGRRLAHPGGWARAPGKREGPAPQPAPRRNLALNESSAASLPFRDDADEAEAAEQLRYELHQIDVCGSDCPWCRRWAP